MQKSFSFTLTGRAWFLLFLFLYVFMAIIVGFSAAIGVNYTRGSLQPGLIAGAVIVFFLIFLCIIGWMVPVYRKFIGSASFDGKPFRFKGSVPAFVGMNLLGLFLTVITLTIYLPWYIRKVSNYIITQTEYDGKPLEFTGKGSALFVTMLWAFYVPVIIIAIAGAAGKTIASGAKFKFFQQMLSQILMIPFGYKMYQWMFNNTSWQGRAAHWNTKFWNAVGFVLGQTFLLFITLFIYWPASTLRIFRYYAARTMVKEGDTVKGRFEFQGKIGKGFLLMWGQLLLSIITLGIYIPWAITKVYRWITSETKFIEG